MDPMTKDETRWLAKLLAFYVIIAALALFFIQISRTAEIVRPTPGTQPASMVWVVLGFGLSMPLFWCGFKLFTCSSLWTLLPASLEQVCLLPVFRSWYFAIHRHVRGGLVAGVMAVLIVWPVPLIRRVCGGTLLVDLIDSIFGAILSPLRPLFKAGFHPDVLFVLLLLYIVAVGFCLGLLISWLGRFTATADSQSETATTEK